MDKKAMRQDAIRWRKALDPGERAAAVRAAVDRLVALPVWTRAQTIALYAALPGEPDLSPLFRAAWEADQRVALPVVAVRHAPLIWREHTPDRALIPGNFRVPQPPSDAPGLDPAAVDLVVVPALLVDDRGYRIGWGGGYYDRSLPLLTRAHRIWLGLDGQRVPEVPTEPFDQPVHAWCTATGSGTFPAGSTASDT